jgi:choline dehydrogenase-like flavoprotein
MIRPLTERSTRRIYGALDVTIGNARHVLDHTYDICVIGSGCGGAVAASTLAAAGLEVVLLERGPFRPPKDYTFQTLDMATRLGHLELTRGYRTALLQGNVLGGSSIIYGAVAMRPPVPVLDEWQRTTGLEDLSAAALQSHYDEIGTTLSVTRQSAEQENRPNAIVRQMAHALGRPEGLHVVQRYTAGCAGVGLCNFGCALDRKGTMLNSFIPIGLESERLTVLTEANVHGLEGERRSGIYRASGARVTCRAADTGADVTRSVVKARAFVVAAGAFFTSALLLRTDDLPHRDRIGAKVFLQPHAQVFALFDQPVTARGEIVEGRYLPFNGVPAIYNFVGFLPDRQFWWLASILFPANLAAFVSHLPADEHAAIMRRYHYSSSVTITMRDNPRRSRVIIDRGHARLDFQESRRDTEILRDSMVHAARGFLSVGARRVFMPLLAPPQITRLEDVDAFARRPLAYDGVLLYSDHTSGGTPMGEDSRDGVTDGCGRLFDTANVYVADSSLFPSSCGTNPSWTIMALSHRVASRLSQSLVSKTAATKGINSSISMTDVEDVLQNSAPQSASIL